MQILLLPLIFQLLFYHNQFVNPRILKSIQKRKKKSLKRRMKMKPKRKILFQMEKKIQSTSKTLKKVLKKVEMIPLF